jgi:uroporphyrinogen-III synthase
VALLQLRQAVAGSAPFAESLAAATALAGPRPEIKADLAKLAADAPNGIPSLAVLRERFARLAGAIANAEAAAAPGWGDRLVGIVRSAFALRRVGASAGGDTAEATAATAEGALDAGDLAGAVKALDGLQGAAATTVKPWLDDAHRRLAAEAALAAATQRATARVAAAPQPQ